MFVPQIYSVALRLFTALLCGPFLAASLASAPPKIPILLDTDIGSDIDDAFALALILESPELDLVGVTTVSGDTEARARLTAKTLWVTGRTDVPVAGGEPSKPSRPLPMEQARWAAGFNSPALRQEKAVDFLQAQIERRPGEITLVAIGPLTNVAALVKEHPEAAKKIKRIALMGGSIARGYEPGSKPAAEYNILSDSLAAQVVFSSGLPILMVPLDASAMLELDAAARRRVFTHLSALTDALTLLYHLWNHETPILFDPMAVAMVIDPTLCEAKQLAVEVDSAGYTRVAEGQAPNATVAVSAHVERFLEFYLSRVAP